MEESELLLVKWTFARFENGIAHFEDVSEKVALLANQKASHANEISSFLEALCDSLRESGRALETRSKSFQAQMAHKLSDPNFEGNFEGVYAFVDDRVRGSEEEASRIEDVLSKLKITQIYTSKSLRKNMEDLGRGLEHLRVAFEGFRDLYQNYIRSCGIKRTEIGSKVGKLESNQRSFQKILERLRTQKTLDAKRVLTEQLSGYRIDIGRTEIDKMMKYFRRADRKKLKKPKQRREIEREIEERWLEMAVKLKLNLQNKLEQLEATRHEAVEGFKRYMQSEGRKMGRRHQHVTGVFDDFFELLEQILRKCLEIERNWKRRVVFAVTDVYGHKKSEDFQIKFGQILKVSIWARIEPD